MKYSAEKSFAKGMDAQDLLNKYRSQFSIPIKNGKEVIYFTGNSLGLQPKNAKKYVDQELQDWALMGVLGHKGAKNPWLPYHEFLTDSTAEITGSQPSEVVVMNTLTVNIHLLLVSFYRPNSSRYKILMEDNAFPSDRYALESQIKFHGYDPKDALITVKSSMGDVCPSTEDILSEIELEKDSLALIFLGGVHYFSGRVFDMKAITDAGHSVGSKVGFDLAHGTGNIPLRLHDWNVDFAAWCSYKYLNGGPGCIAGIFVHEKYHNDQTLPRFAGWWGHDKKSRFDMPSQFEHIPGAEGWQCSNPPIFPLASLRASMEIFQSAGMEALREKSTSLTAYLSFLLSELPLEIITPLSNQERGCQLSLRMKKDGKSVFRKLTESGFIVDWREPDVIRVAPVPLYNSYHEVWEFAEKLKSLV